MDPTLEIWSILMTQVATSESVVEFVCSVANLEVNYVMKRTGFEEICVKLEYIIIALLILPLIYHY